MEKTGKLEAFIRRAGFTWGWENLESWARRMAEQAVHELDAQPAQAAQPVGVPDGWERASEWIADNYDDYSDVNALLRTMDAAAPQPPAQPSADAEDAARYRWLRVHVFDDDNWGQGECNTPTDVDSCVDAARAAEGDGK